MRDIAGPLLRRELRLPALVTRVQRRDLVEEQVGVVAPAGGAAASARRGRIRQPASSSARASTLTRAAITGAEDPPRQGG